MQLARLFLCEGAVFALSFALFADKTRQKRPKAGQQGGRLCLQTRQGCRLKEGQGLQGREGRQGEPAGRATAARQLQPLRTDSPHSLPLPSLPLLAPPFLPALAPPLQPFLAPCLALSAAKPCAVVLPLFFAFSLTWSLALSESCRQAHLTRPALCVFPVVFCLHLAPCLQSKDARKDARKACNLALPC